MKKFDFNTTLGEIIQEMADDGQAFSLQQVRYGSEVYSMLLANGPGPANLLQKFMQAVEAVSGATSERMEFRVESN